MEILLKYLKKPEVVSFITTSYKVYSTQLYVIKFVVADRWLLQQQIAAVIQLKYILKVTLNKYHVLVNM